MFLAFYIGTIGVTFLSILVALLLYLEALKNIGGYRNNKALLILPLFIPVHPFLLKDELTTILMLALVSIICLYPKERRWFRLITVSYIFVAQYLFLTIICEMPGELNIRQPAFLLMVVVASDTGGYIFGKIFGKNKLFPKISPKKTLEGSLGAFILAIFGWFLLFRGLSDNLIMELILVILVCGCAQIGDLLESYAKRRLAMNDSGKLIPGHGGVFDRLDSILGGIFGYSLMIVFGFGI